MIENYITSIKISKPLPEASYLNSLPAVRHLIRQGGLSFEKPVTFLVGENGTGKSTLLEAIAVAAGFNPEGDTRNFTFSTRVGAVPVSDHHPAHAPEGRFFLRTESFYNLAKKTGRDRFIEFKIATQDKGSLALTKTLRVLLLLSTLMLVLN